MKWQYMRAYHSYETAIAKRSQPYNALETGKLGIDDLAPRIKELKSSITNWQQRGTKF